jgi:hypothetical protein
MFSIDKKQLVLGATFFVFFLLLTPLGVFNDWIPADLHTSYYSAVTIDAGDDAAYYAYLRSGFFDGDFDFINEYNYAHFEKFNETGYVFNNWQVGQSVLFLPFFLIGHLGALLLKAWGYPVRIDGYSFPYLMSTAIASQTYLLIGLLVVYRTLKENFDERIALVVTVLVWLAGPLLYYTFVRQRMSHTIEFCFAALFFRYWVKHRLSADPLKHALLGGIAGLMCSIRVINGAMFALYFVDQLVLALANRDTRFSADSLRALAMRWLYFLGFWFVLFLPQLVSWRGIDGAPLPVYHLGLAKGEASSFAIGTLIDHTHQFFFGAAWGLVYSSPVIFAGWIGLFLKQSSLKDARPALVCGGAVFIAVVVLLFVHLAAYEYRYLSPALPIFAFGLATLLSKCPKNPAYWVMVWIAGGVCIFLQYMMIVQYSITTAYNDPQFVIKTLTNIPAIFANQPSLLWYSTSWTKLFFLKAGAWNFKDYMFLLLFPGVQLAVVFAILAVNAWMGQRVECPAWFKPRTLMAGAVVFVLVWSAHIVRMTPAKTPQEIAVRQEYVQLIKTGESLQGEGKLDEAIDRFVKARSLQPGLFAPLFRIGAVLSHQGKIDESNRSFMKILEMFPDHSPTLSYLGLNLMRLGKFSEAEAYIQAAIRIAPGDSYSRDLLFTLRKYQREIEGK